MGKARSSRRMRNCKSRTKRGGGFSFFLSKPTNGYTELDDGEKSQLSTTVEEEGVLPKRITRTSTSTTRPTSTPPSGGKSRRRHRRVKFGKSKKGRTTRRIVRKHRR